MKPAICFIDDSRYEHDVVEKEIAPFAPDYEFVQAYTFAEARDIFGNERPPALFLLDLWGRDEDVLEPSLTPKEELERRVRDFPTIDGVFEGLEDFSGDVTNEYLKRFFVIVDCWRSLFEEACNRLGQNRKYGISNLREAKSVYPGVPVVFYTRKSLINDAVDMFREGADGLFIKPTGRTDEDTRRLTREYAPQLMGELTRIVKTHNEGPPCG